MSESEKFWDKIAEKYSKQPIADEVAYQKKLEVTRNYLKPDMNILEFGCGTGSTSISHSPFVKHIHAIDSSSKMIAIAQDKADKQNIDNITFEKLSIDDLNIPDQSLDVVLGLSILHLIDNKEDVIAKVYKKLKSGGVFISSTVCLGDKMKFFKLIIPIGKFFGLMPLVKVFTAKELEQSLNQVGFSTDYIWQTGKFNIAFIVAKKD